jgi:hypothetical protein
MNYWPQGNVQVIDEEEKWISKYRAALNATSTQQSTAGTFAARLKGIMQSLVSALNKAAHGQATIAVAAKPLEKPPCPEIALPRTPAGREEAQSHHSTGKRRVQQQRSRRGKKRAS